MYDIDEGFSEFTMNQDTAVLHALERTDKGLFDVDDSRDEDLTALFDR
ncbi:MAG: hypothetical protein AAGJ28_21990 [Pseudomonadota bacterium]